MTETPARPESREDPEVPSFRAVFDAEFSYVWNALRRLGVREADLLDQCQEVFLVVHNLLADYDPTRPIRPWLFAIAYRVASRYRSLARHKREVLGDEPREPVDAAPRPDEKLEGAEARALMLEAIDGIELGRRAVFILSEIEERPMPEIAEALQIPVNTAYSRLRLAREDFAAAVQRIRARTAHPREARGGQHEGKR
jgi:RNA polymerase sigma-70 factor (ECF subfamily)